MTEAEWLACRDPAAMLPGLDPCRWDRKLRLFACACCRRVWPAMPEERGRRLVELSERYADGQTSYQELRAAVEAPTTAGSRWDPINHAAELATACSAASYLASAEDYARAAQGIVAVRGREATPGRLTGPPLSPVEIVARATAERAEREAQCGVLRDVVGPFLFRQVRLDPLWLAWNDSVSVQLTRSVYERRDFDRLPILADALEDAGCVDADLLSHLRGPGPHVRGCWALDLILGKE
jgi:hypothetical protein